MASSSNNGGFDKGEKWRRMEGRLKNPTLALKNIGLIVQSASRRAFVDQSFDGRGWQPRAVPNRYGIIDDLSGSAVKPPKRRFEPRPALINTAGAGGLESSIQHEVRGSRRVRIGVFGTAEEYAPLMNFGGRTESKPITRRVQEKLAKWLKGEGKEWADRLRSLTRKGMENQKLEGEVPARKFIGITPQIRKDIVAEVGFSVMEAK